MKIEKDVNELITDIESNYIKEAKFIEECSIANELRKKRLDIGKRAMQGLIIAKPNLSPKSVAKLSLEYADALLEAL